MEKLKAKLDELISELSADKQEVMKKKDARRAFDIVEEQQMYLLEKRREIYE